jgi:ABC-2 type transport system ATP-binding protein
MPVLSLRHVTIRYGDLVAVRDLSLDVAAGEIFGLLGPNGSGKSSTIAAVAGDHPPDEGTVRIAGRTDSESPLDYRRRLGLVPQEIALFEELTAGQNLAFFGRLYGLTGARLRDRLDEVLEFVRLAEHARRPVRTFSGGMQRRLNLACALLHRPSVLLLDEPTVGLDVQSREAIFGCLRQLRDDGAAMVFTTHHLEEAEQLCDRVGIMDHGRLIASGPIAELCEEGRWRLDGPHAPRALERVYLELTGGSQREP